MKKRKKILPMLLGGGAIGAANGLLGGGGGMIAVPLLRKTAGLSPLRAHATAIAVILPASVLSGAIYCAEGLVPLGIFLPAALGVAAGGLIGAKLLGVLPVRIVEAAFALLMLAAGLRMVF